jgi:hypothetical protein
MAVVLPMNVALIFCVPGQFAGSTEYQAIERT